MIQQVQGLVCHPDRLKAMDYIKAICMDFMELHGDRLFGEDPAIICGIGKIQNKSIIAERSEERRVGKECRSRWSPYH